MSAKWFVACFGIWPVLAWCCGVCDEDKIAATYDHAVIKRAAAARQSLVFVAMQTSVEPHAFAKRVASVAPGVRGILRGSVRTAIAPVAFSFVIDPKVQTPSSAVAELGRLLNVESGLRILRIVPAEASQS